MKRSFGIPVCVACVVVAPLLFAGCASRPVPPAATETRDHTPQEIHFRTSDGALIYGNLYGSGDRGVVLAHGGQFNKESWDAQAQDLAGIGFVVLALDFRGYGRSTGPGQSNPLTAPLYEDVLGAVHYLHRIGARSVTVVGASMGGAAAADASAISKPGEIDRVMLVSSGAGEKGARKMKGRKLFITTRDDLAADGTPRLKTINDAYEKARGPKQLVILHGSAHGQHIFASDQGPRLMRELLRFVAER